MKQLIACFYQVSVGSFLDYDTAPTSYTLTLTVYDDDGAVSQDFPSHSTNHLFKNV